MPGSYNIRDECAVREGDICEGVFRRRRDGWTPWVIVAPSAILRDGQNGMGFYGVSVQEGSRWIVRRNNCWSILINRRL